MTRTQRNAHNASAVGQAFGRALATGIEKRGLTITALSRRAAIDRSFLHQLLSGERQPSIAVFIALADALEIAPERLMWRVRCELQER